MFDPQERQQLRRHLDTPLEGIDLVTRIEHALEFMGLTVVPVNSPITDEEADKAALQAWNSAPSEIRDLLRRMRMLERFLSDDAPPVIIKNQRRILVRSLARTMAWATALQCSLIDEEIQEDEAEADQGEDWDDEDELTKTERRILFLRSAHRCAVCGHMEGDHERIRVGVWSCDDDGCEDNDYCTVPSGNGP